MIADTARKPADAHWTDAQWLGISLTGKSLLVSAAAGSGKTAVLARRCVYLVCEADPRCDIDELLVVTFTEKAADEMRARITRALRKQAESSPSEHLLKQLALVDQANVSTLHAFCARLLRQHFHLVGLDPAFTVLAGEEASLLRREVARDLFEKRYDDEDGKFQRLIDGYGQGNDETVMRQMLHVYELLTSVVNPAKWIEDSRRRIADAIELPLHETEMGKELSAIIRRGLDSIRRRCDEAIAEIERLGVGKFADYARDMAGTFRYWAEAFDEGGVDALAEVAQDPQWPRLPTVKADVPGKELAKSLIDAIRDDAKDGAWRDILRFSMKDWRDGLGKMQPFADVFLELVEQFGKEYGRAKREIRAVDFADLERFTLSALSEANDAGKPSPAARTFHKRFSHVLVDEFQDINEVQDAILSLISRESGRNPEPRTLNSLPPNLFCVGDVKQSIYRFRLAEARRFLDRQQAFRGKNSHGRVVDLQANFRSRRPLLDALNCVFSRVMTADAVDIDYDQSHWLKSGTQYPPADEGRSFHGAPIELHLIPDAPADKREGAPADAAVEQDEDDEEEIGRTEREAILIARRILAITGKDAARPNPAMQVAKKEDHQPEMTYRDATFSDIVILLRSMKFKADQFANVLRQHGIPVYAASNAGYFASMEVRDMLALLGLMDNQRQDIPLAAIIRSPLTMIAEPEAVLAAVRAEFGPSIPFHEAAIRYADEKHDDFSKAMKSLFSQIENWRTEAQLRPLADVIWDIYHQSGYLAYVAGLEKGEQRVKNLLDLHERAAEFGKFQSRGLSRFMRFLEELQDESDLGQPSTASEAEDVVRIMSVHASKGLEFPIVFVPDLGKRINLQSCGGPILADRSAGLGMVVVDEAKRCRYPSLASTLVRNRLRQQSLAEELRVLYVALTRAKEHLILIGTTKLSAPEKWVTRWQGHCGPMPTDAILAAGTMLDWIGPAEVMTRVEPLPIFHPALYSPEEIADWRTPASVRRHFTPAQKALARLTPLAAVAAMTPDARSVIDRLSTAYAFENFSRMRATQSVTSIGHGAGPNRAATSAIAPTSSVAPVSAIAAIGPVAGVAPASAIAAIGPVAGVVPVSAVTAIGPVGAAAPAIKVFAATDLLPAQPKFVKQAELSATDRGTATHLVLQYLNFEDTCDLTDVGVQVEKLIHRKILTRAEAKAVDKAAIVWLMADPIGRRLRQNDKIVRRELPVNFPSPFTVGANQHPLDRVMVRGRIDVLILNGKKATLLDYKTDKVTLEQVPARAETYRVQLFAYRDALQKIADLQIKDVYLAFLSPRIMFAMKE